MFDIMFYVYRKYTTCTKSVILLLQKSIVFYFCQNNKTESFFLLYNFPHFAFFPWFYSSFYTMFFFCFISFRLSLWLFYAGFYFIHIFIFYFTFYPFYSIFPFITSLTHAESNKTHWKGPDVYVVLVRFTCGSDVLRPLPRLHLQVVDQRPDGQRPQRVRIALIGRNWNGKGEVNRPDLIWTRVQGNQRERVSYLPCVRSLRTFWWRLLPPWSPWRWSSASCFLRRPGRCRPFWTRTRTRRIGFKHTL